MSEHRLSGLEVIAKVIRHCYDLGDVQTPEQLPSAHQRRHRKMTVDTSAGKFLVKTYKRDPVALDALGFQHRLSEHLYENELPVARIQKAKNGKTIVEADSWALELQEFKDGHSMQVNSTTLKRSAEALGKFHDVCREFPCPPKDANIWRFSEVPRDMFEHFFDKAKEDPDDIEVEKHCDNIVKFMQEAAEHLDISKRSEFETGLIHGDWHGANLLFDKNTLLAIIDLEFAGDGCYLEDIAYAISNLCIRTTANEEKMEYRCNLLLDHYQFYRPLSYTELVALFFAAGIKHVTTVSYQTLHHGKIAGRSAAKWLELLDTQTQWLAQESHKARWGER